MNILFERKIELPNLWETTVEGFEPYQLTEAMQKLEIISLNENLGRYILKSAGIIREIVDYLRSDSFRLQLLDKMTIELSVLQTCVSVGVYIEQSGRFTSKHTDFPSGDLATGMIFFNHEQDNNQATIFYRDDGVTEAYTAINKSGKGWFMPITPTTWHKGGNFTNRPRYFILYNLKRV